MRVGRLKVAVVVIGDAIPVSSSAKHQFNQHRKHFFSAPLRLCVNPRHLCPNLLAASVSVSVSVSIRAICAQICWRPLCPCPCLRPCQSAPSVPKSAGGL